MSNKNEITFKAALSKLEKSVKRLEEDDIDLEKFVEIFTEGVQSATICQRKLNGAREKIDIVLKEFEGTAKELQPFDESDLTGEE